MERDKFMSPKEAMEFGLVDRILEHPPRQGWRHSKELIVSQKLVKPFFKENVLCRVG